VVGVGEAQCHICASVRTGRRQPPLCTSLLYDPAAMLSARQRWPKHLCYSDFMERSIERWIFQAVPQITPANTLWAECYPLPIGEAAARRRYTQRGQICDAELIGILPFEGAEEAYWALRVATNRSVLDMCGLKGWMPPTEDARVFMVWQFRGFVARPRRYVFGWVDAELRAVVARLLFGDRESALGIQNSEEFVKAHAKGGTQGLLREHPRMSSYEVAVQRVGSGGD
jgi:hypothetical protein